MLLLVTPKAQSFGEITARLDFIKLKASLLKKVPNKCKDQPQTKGEKCVKDTCGKELLFNIYKQFLIIIRKQRTS